jgi:predicted nucleic acid-binding Zn ribbon protein
MDVRKVASVQRLTGNPHAKMIPPKNMEPASKVIRGLRLPGETFAAEELACAAWPNAVGKRISTHTRPARLVRTKLVVEVEDRIWQRQLFALTSQILTNLIKRIGPGIVDDLEFKIVPRRREPARAQVSVPPLLDESDGIADPVLRGIYRAARKKAVAS